MKKIFYIFLIILYIINSKIKIEDQKYTLKYNDLNTSNIETKLSSIGINNISKFCTYDFCSSINSDNFKTAINKFTRKYLDTINDDESKNTLKVQGIKIVKIGLRH